MTAIRPGTIFMTDGDPVLPSVELGRALRSVIERWDARWPSLQGHHIVFGSPRPLPDSAGEPQQ